MRYFISLIGTSWSICVCALSLSGAVCKMDTRKEDLVLGSWGGVALPDCRPNRKNREAVRSVIQHRADLVLLLHFPSSPRSPSSFYRREHFLCPRPLPLLVSRCRTSFRNERHGLSFFLHPVDLRQVLFSPEKAGERTESGEECFGNQFCRAIHRREKAMPGYRWERARRFDFAEKGLSSCCKLYMYINFIKFYAIQVFKLQHDLFFYELKLTWLYMLYFFTRLSSRVVHMGTTSILHRLHVLRKG